MIKQRKNASAISKSITKKDTLVVGVNELKKIVDYSSMPVML